MIVNYKYRLYVNKHTEELSQLVTTANVVWNHIVALYRRFYQMYGKNPSCTKVQSHIAKLAKRNPYWSLMGSQSLQEIAQRVDLVYKAFFKRKGHGRPRFHKVRETGSFCFKGSVGYKLEGNVLTINKLHHSFKFKLTRDYGTIKTIRIKRDSNGYLYLVVCTEVADESLKRTGNAAIGLDFGMKCFLATSDGEYIESPLVYKKSLKTLAKKARNFSKKQKGSNGRKKAKKALVKYHAHIANCRADFQWKLAHELCKTCSFIAIEDLNMKAMQRHKNWGRKVSDLAYGEFVQKLMHVAKKYGTEVVKIDRWAPSSQLCSACGYRNKEVKDLNIREWKCPVCGAVHDRDINAAINILSIAAKGKGISLDKSQVRHCNPPIAAHWR